MKYFIEWEPTSIFEIKEKIEVFQKFEPEIKSIVIYQLSIRYISEGYGTLEDISCWFNEDKTVNEENFISFINKKLNEL